MKYTIGSVKKALVAIPRIKILGLVSLLILSANVYGQDMLTATIAAQQVHDFQRERIRSEYEEEKVRIKEGNHNKIASRNSKTATDRNVLGFSFRADNDIVQRVEKEIIANLKSKNPASGKNLQETLARDRPYPKYVVRFKKLGLNGESNYVDVFTAYILGMWRIANRMEDNPTPDEIQAVRRQFISNVDVSGLNSQQKQEKAAHLIYDLIFANEPYEASRSAKDLKQMRSDADEVNNRFIKENGMNLRDMEITEKGLTNKK